jgi:hypothetical protein
MISAVDDPLFLRCRFETKAMKQKTPREYHPVASSSPVFLNY